jgi:hypothetical protein
MDYGVERYPVGAATQRSSSRRSTKVGSYLTETKSELCAFKKLNPHISSIPAIIITGATGLLGLGVAGVKKVIKLL